MKGRRGLGNAMRWSALGLLLGLALAAGCLGLPTDDAAPASSEPMAHEVPPGAPPVHPDPDGEGSLDEPVEGGFSMTHVPPGDYATDLDGHSTVLEEGPYEVGEERVVELESPIDGAAVQVGLVLPDVPEGTQVPVIGVATPYFYGTDLHELDLAEHDRLARYVDNHLPHGYAVAAIPVRGTAGNGGCMTMGGHPETVDVDHAVTWLGEAPFGNGNVALVGLSYDGWTAWEAAATGNPHLATIVPVGGLNDWHAYWHPNGTSRIQGAGYLNAAYHAFGLLPWRGVEKVQQNLVCPEAAHGLAAAGYSTSTGERDPTGYWADRSAREGAMANYTGSVFAVHGLQDWNVRPSNVEPWVGELVDAGIPVKRMYGQWRHAFPDYTPSFDAVNPHARWDFAQTLHNWFAYWLKGDTSRDLGPPVQVQRDDGAWRSAWTWPGADGTRQAYELSPDGRLSENGTAETGLAPLGPDPGRTGPHDRPLAKLCQACPSFTSDPLDEAATISGRPRVHVTVTPTSPAPGHASAFLYATGEDEARLLGWGTIDLRFADGGEDAEPVVPGQPVEVHLSLEPLEGRVGAGERLELVLSQGARDTDPRETGHGPTTTDVSSAPPTGMLLHTGDAQSTLALERLDPDETATFTPPGG